MMISCTLAQCSLDCRNLALMKEMELMMESCVETGFRPALVWTRAYSQNSNNNCHWLIYDTLINPNNESDQILYANLSNGQGSHSSIGIDILSNGFKLKADTAGYSNYSGWSYLYCAWAEAPAFNLYGAQSTAR